MNKDMFRMSLVAGIIGAVLGATSMQAAQQIWDASASHDRPSARSIKDEALENYDEHNAGSRADVMRPTKTLP